MHLVPSVELNNKVVYEIYSGSFADPMMKAYHDRLQVSTSEQHKDVQQGEDAIRCDAMR